MNQLTRLAAVAALLAAGPALADTAETKGGIRIKTDDGRFEANLGGRIHLDYYTLMEDDTAGSRSSTQPPVGGAEFRRTRITLSGKAYGWDYKFECDFTSSGTGCYRDMYLATALGPGKVTIGHFKPYRGMEELTSSNEITLMERPFASASGVFANRQFGTGLGWQANLAERFTLGVYAQNQYSHQNPTRNEGWQYGGRFTFAPMMDEGSTLHLGASGGIENGSNLAPASIRASSANYGGRRGASLTLGTAGAASATAGNDVTHVGLELAGAFGPAFFQAEAMQLTLADAALVSGTPEDQDVLAWYAMASWFVTGESKAYKKATGVFASPKPKNAFGAFELVARYDVAENQDALAGVDAEASAITAGLNWYTNPNVRFMLNYTVGTGDNNSVAPGFEDEPEHVGVRAQFSF